MTTAPPLISHPGESGSSTASPLLTPHSDPAPAGEPLGVGELLDIAQGLVGSAPRWPGMSRPRRRAWDLMAAAANFEAWVIAWPTGGRIDLHDHGSSAGVAVVVSGELRETTLVEDGTGLGSWLTRVVTSGESVSFGATYVHGFLNVEASPAVSVHVYSPRLRSMTYFDLVAGRLEPVWIRRYHDDPLVP